ncbi:MAG: phosphatase PAP2 family protein [Desulfobulbaceae bacterium]
MLPADILLLDWLSLQRTSVLDAFFRAITWAGSLSLLFPATLLLLILLRGKGRQREMRLVVFSMTSAVLVVHAAKVFFKRPRPEIHPGLIAMPADWSFPSAHAAQIATFCLCVALIAKRNFPVPWVWLTALLAIALTAGVSVSRVYLQVHYPTDVLAGLLFGIVIVAVADRLSKS